MSKLLFLQFRTDESEAHEQVCVLRHVPAGATIDFLNVHREDAPPQLLENYDGLLLGGLGEADLSQNNDIIRDVVKQSEAIILQAIDKDFPTLGVCFGHQLIAHIAGGRVVHDPELAETGIIEIHRQTVADPLFDRLPETFLAVVGHKDTVVELPTGASALSQSDVAPNHAFRLGNNIYGVQYHGELDENDLRERLRLYPDYTKHARELIFQPTPYAPLILRYFVERYS